MIRRLRRSIAQNVVAWLALFVALGGTSLAASHYVITSSKQIKPSVLRSIVDNTTASRKLFNSLIPGAHVASANSATTAGSASTAGSATTAASAGHASSADSATTAASATSPGVLGHGQTETGVWSASAPETPAYASISFPFPLASPPAVHLIELGEKPPAGCSGSAAAPAASPGNLCVFAAFMYKAQFGGVFDPGTSTEAAASVRGAIVYLEQLSAGEYAGDGTWAVTG